MNHTRALTIEVDIELDDALSRLSQSTGRDKSAITRDALNEWLQAQEDIAEAERILAEGNPGLTLAEARQALDLED